LPIFHGGMRSNHQKLPTVPRHRHRYADASSLCNSKYRELAMPLDLTGSDFRADFAMGERGLIAWRLCCSYGGHAHGPPNLDHHAVRFIAFLSYQRHVIKFHCLNRNVYLEFSPRAKYPIHHVARSDFLICRLRDDTHHERHP